MENLLARFLCFADGSSGLKGWNVMVLVQGEAKPPSKLLMPYMSSFRLLVSWWYWFRSSAVAMGFPVGSVILCCSVVN